MQSFRGVTAVVTGAGSGIGRGLCTAFGEEGGRVVAADVDAAALDDTVCRLRAAGVTAVGQVTDVADPAAVQALADRAFGEFGAVHVLCNNAGVFLGGLIWETAEVDWDWVLGVNVRGIVNGIRAFVPRMLAQDADGHVLNTASIAGLATTPLSSPYCVSKAAAVALTECLGHDLAAMGSRLGVSVIVPGSVRTGIAESERHRPARWQGPPVASAGAVASALAELTAQGKDPLTAARRILAGVKAGWFYIPTNDSYDDFVGTVNAARAERRLPPFPTFD